MSSWVIAVANIAVSLFEALCLGIFMSTFVEIRLVKGRPIRTIYIVAGYFLILRGCSGLALPLVAKAMLIIVFFALAAFLFYRAKPITLVVLCILFYFLLVLTETIVLAILIALFSSNSVGVQDSPVQFVLGMIVSKIVQYMLVIAIRKFWLNQKIDGSDGNSTWGFLLFPPAIALAAVSTFMICLTEDLTTMQLTAISVSSTGLMFLGAIMFYIMDSLVDRQRRIRENALLQQKVEIEMASISTLSSSINSQRKMMHDYNNHIATIKQLLHKQQYAHVSEYVRNMSETLETSFYRIKTNNEVVDAILNQKDLVARSNEIDVHYVTNNLAGVPMQSDDLVTIIANALDNAIEATAQLEIARRRMDVKLEYENGVLVFSVLNPVAAKVKIENNRIKTTKKDKISHGLGLANIQTALDKYNAGYELFCDEQSFQFTTIVTL